MPKHPDVSGEEAVRALKRLGFVFLRQQAGVTLEEFIENL